MLIGGWGSLAGQAVAEAADRARLELVQEGALVLAAPAGSLQSAEKDGTRVWVAGRLELDGTGPGGGASPAAAAAAALAQAGDAALEHIYGAYVLVAADRARRRVWVARDHLGARTVMLWRRGADVLFAEHLVDLLALLPSTPAPDRLTVVQWLDRRTLPIGRSMFAGVERLPCGETIEMSENGVAVRPYWRPRYHPPRHTSYTDSARFVQEAAFDAVERAAADLRRPAVQLSGGLDSACVAAGLAARREDRPLALARTFPDYPEVDETSLIARTPRVSGVDLVALPYSDAPMFPAVAEYIQRWAVPPTSPNLAIWGPLMAAARQRDADGVLDGEGGDEVFGVFPYLIADRVGHGRLRSAWRLCGALPGVGAPVPWRMRLEVLRVYGVSGAAPRRLQRSRRRLRETRAGVGPLVTDADVPGLLAQDDAWEWKAANGPRWWTQAVDVLLNGAERMEVNGELRRAAIGFGVDRRHPFTHDARLVEAILSVAPQLSFDAHRDRPLLRDGLSGLIPEEVRTRHAKSYFNSLSVHALAGGEGAAVLDQISSANAPVREYVRPEAFELVSKVTSAQGQNQARLADLLFRMAVIDQWLRHLQGAPGPTGGGSPG